MADQKRDPTPDPQEQDQWSENPQPGGPSQDRTDSDGGTRADDADEIVNAGEG